MRSGSGRIIEKRASSSHCTLPGILNVYRSTKWPFQKSIVHEHLLCSNNSAILFHLHLGVSGRRCLQFAQQGGVHKQVERTVRNGRLAATIPYGIPRYLILAGLKRWALAVGPRCGPWAFPRCQIIKSEDFLGVSMSSCVVQGLGSISKSWPISVAVVWSALSS
jgi:hypothetical protein